MRSAIGAQPAPEMKKAGPLQACPVETMNLRAPFSYEPSSSVAGPPLILSRNRPDHLKVTTRLGASTMLSPVAGFRPRRSRFCAAQAA